MATTAELAAGVRGMLRDFPKFFEINEGPLNVLTIRLPHPLVASTTMQVYVVTPPVAPATDVTTAITKAWTLDERNGLLKLTDASFLGKSVIISGHYYVWFSDGDLTLALGQAAAEQFVDRDMTIQCMDPVEAEVLMIGGVVRALWSLSIELALDIDVSTPEGMFIPAHQRYSQVIQQMQFWEGQYESKMASLNIGLGALDQYKLRRVSYTTGRYVPVYKDREFNDPRWPERLWPDIPAEPSNRTPAWAIAQQATGVVQYGIDYPSATWPEFLGGGPDACP